MENIIEKLGISRNKWIGLHGEGVDKRGNKHVFSGIQTVCVVSKNENDGRNCSLITSSPEMLEALIEDVFEYEKTLENGGFPTPNMVKRVDRNIRLIQKATGKFWDEVKEILK